MAVLYVKQGDRVEAEAAALAAAAELAGVVDLVGVEDGLLRIVRVDGRPLGDLGPLPPEEVAGVAGAVAEVLADLHDLGLVHGAVDPTHVLVGRDGRVRLCSLGRTGDPADDVAALGGLVTELLEEETAGARPPWPRRSAWRREAARTRLRSPRRLGPMLQPPAAPALLALAGQAIAADPARRPTARALATAIHEQIPGAALPVLPAGRLLPRASVPPTRRRGDAERRRRRVLRSSRRLDPAGGPNRPEPSGGKAGTGGVAPTDGDAQWRRRTRSRPGAALPRLVLVAGVAGCAGLVVLVDRAARTDPSATYAGPATTGVAASAQANATSRPRTATSTSGPTPASTAPTASTHPSGRRARAATEPGAGTGAPTPATPPAPAATRVWPPEPVAYADGVLTMDGTRYAVGQPGDEVATGDWSCSGHPTLALLRPATGEVFAFDGWASAGRDLAARRLARVAGATSIRAVDADGDGCDDLAAERPGQEPVLVETDR